MRLSCSFRVICWITATTALGAAELDFFAEQKPARIEIEIATNFFPALNKTNRNYVPGSVRVENARLDQVGIRLKGWSSFQPVHLKPSMSVKLDAFVPHQRLKGMGKLILNNSKQDPSCLRELLANSLFSDAQVPAPRCRLVRVRLNERDLGVYIAVEAVNKDFLRRAFGNSSGSLYEGFMQDIGGELEIDNGRESNYSELRALQAAAEISDPGLRWAELGQHLDLSRFFSYAGLSMVLGGQDTYVSNGNNYRIYRDPGARRFVFIPHGLDTTFICGREIEPSTGMLLVRNLIACPPGREHYRAALWHVVTNTWNVTAITNRIARGVQQLIELSESELERSRAVEQGEILVAQVIARRLEVLAALTQPPVVSPEFDMHGQASLTNWFPAAFTFAPAFERVTNGSRVFLKIEAARKTVGSWRTRLLLPAGDFEMSCRARNEGRPGAEGRSPSASRFVAAGLTVVECPIPSGGEWRDVTLNFSLPHGGSIVDVICEHSAGAGVSIFDLDSLRIKRVPRKTE